MTENNVHHGADIAPIQAYAADENDDARERRAFPVRAVDGAIVHSPAPAVEKDGYLSITLGNRGDNHLTAELNLNEGEDFWRLWLPDHEGTALSSAERQNDVARLAIQAASLLLLLNGGPIGGRA